jgi:hypothetical protein
MEGIGIARSVATPKMTPFASIVTVVAPFVSPSKHALNSFIIHYSSLSIPSWFHPTKPNPKTESEVFRHQEG